MKLAPYQIKNILIAIACMAFGVIVSVLPAHSFWTQIFRYAGLSFAFGAFQGAKVYAPFRWAITFFGIYWLMVMVSALIAPMFGFKVPT